MVNGMEETRFVIDKNIPFPTTKGRKPKTKEYKLGTLMHEDLEIGESISLEKVNPKFVMIRIMRLNEKSKVKKEFIYREEGENYRFWRKS